MRGGTLLAVAAVTVAAFACSGDDGATTTTIGQPPTAPAPTSAGRPTSTSVAAATTTASTSPTSPAPTTTAVSGRPARIPTSSVATGQQAQLHLDLRYEPDTGCIFAGDELPVWPPGYTASLDPLGVRDAQGNVVATVGGPTYEIGGGHADVRSLEDLSFADCAAAVGGALVLVGVP